MYHGMVDTLLTQIKTIKNVFPREISILIQNSIGTPSKCYFTIHFASYY